MSNFNNDAWTNFMNNHQSLPMPQRPFPVQKAGIVNMEEVIKPLFLLDAIPYEQKHFLRTGLQELV